MNKKIILKIDATFGSRFQKETALDSLALILKAWTTFYQNNHKKNKIKYDLEFED